MPRSLILLLISIVASAHPAMGQITLSQDAAGAIHEREISLFEVDYIVRYEVAREAIALVPGTYPPGKPHWDATIEIWKQKGNMREKIGASFLGSYVDGGCAEDDPEMLVRRQLHLPLDKFVGPITTKGRVSPSKHNPKEKK